MKVLVVHNRYVSSVPSGENTVVDNEIASLRESGVEVVTYLRSSDEIPDFGALERLTLPLRPTWSRRDTSAIRELIAVERPDVMHLHNPNPLISMAAVRVARRAGVPVVQTVHNHRHTCLNGLFLRDGRDCHDCLGRRLPWPGMVHACYRDSNAQSVAMGVALATHYGTYRMIDRLIALTPEIAASLRASGFDPQRIVVKPNAVPDPGPATPPGRGVVFVGRLRDEKGVALLLDAWSRHPDGALGPLTFVGDGPDAPLVRAAAAGRSDVVAAGQLDRGGVGTAIRSAAAVVVPSIWSEALPLIVLEAFASGRPVVATNVGGLPAVVTPDVGWVVEPTVDALAGALARTADVGSRGKAARELYESTYSPQVVLQQLVAIYRDAASTRR